MEPERKTLIPRNDDDAEAYIEIRLRLDVADAWDLVRVLNLDPERKFAEWADGMQETLLTKRTTQGESGNAGHLRT